jgi:hypothetical protein
MSGIGEIGVYRPNRTAVVLWPTGQELTEGDLASLKSQRRYDADRHYRARVDELHELARWQGRRESQP